MRFSESGRGADQRDLSPTEREIDVSLKIYKNLESKFDFPKIKISPAVRSNLLGKILTSLNISNNGLLLSNPWAYNLGGSPKDYCVLGSLVDKQLSVLAGANIYQRFFIQVRRNLKWR